MSSDDRDRLEMEINRYLDGEISDSEFEAFLSEQPEGFNIERFRKLKTRVEKIEEVYRQFEEPEVPDGYWETFADRVDEKIGADEKTPVWERFLNIILPTRWPRVTYGYVGAVASVLLVFVIGRSILEHGADKYQPVSKEPAAIYQKTGPATPKGESDAAEEWERKEEKSAATEAIESDDTEADEGLFADKLSFGEPAADEQIQPEKSTTKGSSGSPAEGHRETTAGEPIALENLRLSTNESEPMSVAVEPPPEMSFVPEELAMPAPEPTTEKRLLMTKEQTAVPPIEPEEQELYEAFKMTTDRGKDVGKAATTESWMSPATRIDLSSDSMRVWKYDNWDLTSLRDRIKLYEKILSDSAYSSPTFTDYAEMRSSVAILTRDSIDIYDAVNAIDTVLNYNKQIDENSWKVRREQIRSLRNSKFDR